MNLAGEEEKETCTGKRLRSHDSTTAWGSSSSDAADAAGETERTLTKHARRRPAGAQAAEMEPAQKKRLREGKLKEDEQENSVKQKLEHNPDAANPQHDPQLPGAPPPGATAQEESTQPNLTRGAGYDTTNNMNLFLTQCCGCSITLARSPRSPPSTLPCWCHFAMLPTIILQSSLPLAFCHHHCQHHSAVPPPIHHELTGHGVRCCPPPSSRNPAKSQT